MSNVAEAPPWAGTDIDPERIVEELRRRFPGVSAWLREFTGRWWAITPRDARNRGRLVEAATPAALGRRLEELGARRWPPVAEADGLSRDVRTDSQPRVAPPDSKTSDGPWRGVPSGLARGKRRCWLRDALCRMGWLQ